MLGSINPNLDFWEQIDNEESYTDLIMAIEFSNPQRVSLFIAVCDADLTQAEIINRYTQQLAPKFHHYLVSVDNRHLNISRSIADLLPPSTDGQQHPQPFISVVGATSLSPFTLVPNSTKSERDTFFGYLQWQRERFQSFHFPIVLWVSKNIYDLMLSETSDFWSWRNGVFFFKSTNIATASPFLSESIDRFDRNLDFTVDESIPLADLEELARRITDRNPLDPLSINLYNRLGKLYQNRLDGGKSEHYLTEQHLAIQYFQKAIDVASKSNLYGQYLADSLNNLASLYKSMGRYDEAEPLYVRSLAIMEEQLGANHPDTATSLNNLALLYYLMGKYAAAEPLYVRALAVREEQLGANHPDTAISLNLAGLYESMGRYGEAEPLYVRALAVREEQLGANHPDTATSLNNLALLYESMGRYGEAKPLYVRALAIKEEQLGANHPNTATSLNNLAGLYRSMGRYGEAEPLLVRALAIKEEQLGANHPSTATSLNNLAGLYESMGRSGEAKPLYVRALAVREEQLGANHPDTATSLNNLAGLYESMGSYDEAKPLYVRALDIVERSLGANHPSTQTIRTNLESLRQELALSKNDENLL